MMESSFPVIPLHPHHLFFLKQAGVFLCVLLCKICPHVEYELHKREVLKQLKGKSAFSDPHITTSGHSCRGKHKSAQMKNAASPSRSLETCTASSTSQVQGRSNRCKKERKMQHTLCQTTLGAHSHTLTLRPECWKQNENLILS